MRPRSPIVHTSGTAFTAAGGADEFRQHNSQRDVRIDNPKGSPGVVMGNASNPIDVTFDGVVVTNPGADPWGDDYYSCWGANGSAIGGTWPVPPCFNGGRQCLADGVCVDAAGTPCCSGSEHFTLECPLAAGGKRCGSAN